MKLFFFAALTLIASPILAAPAISAADKELAAQFETVIKANDVKGAKKLIAAPNFRPLLSDGGDSVFDKALKSQRVAMARLMMASPAWKKTTWDAKNTAMPLITSAFFPSLLPILQELSRQPHFDLNTPGANGGEFPLNYAANNDNIAALKWLTVQPKVKITARNADGQNALFGAGAKATIYLLSLKKFDVNARDNQGRAALHSAVSENDVPKVRALLAAPKLDANIKDKTGQTALDIALDIGLTHDKTVCQMLMANLKIKPTAAQRALFKRVQSQAPSGGGG